LLSPATFATKSAFVILFPPLIDSIRPIKQPQPACFRRLITSLFLIG
jgi:hypothetical protein